CEPSLECGVLTPASATPGAPTPKCCAAPQVWLLHPPTVALPGSAGYATAFFEPHLAVISYVPCHIILRSMECSVNENVATNTKQARLITAGPAWFTGGHFRRTISISLAHQGQYRNSVIPGMIVPVDCGWTVKIFTSRLLVRGWPLMPKPIRT